MEEIKIVVVGDFRANSIDGVHVDERIGDLFTNADICICNFEAPIHIENKTDLPPKSGPSLSQSQDCPLWLKKRGFNVILMANNHIMDFGVDGLNATLDAFNDVTTLGAGRAKDAYSPKFLNVKGRRIGLLSLVQHEFGVIEGKHERGMGAAWLCSPDVPDIIINAKHECDSLLVFPHAGVEHTIAPLPEWRAYYRKLVDWGADCVIATHPHCPQGWERYNDKCIYYSLGNFYFDELSYDDLWYRSIVLELSVGKKIISKEHFICFDDKKGTISVDNSSTIRDYIHHANFLLVDKSAYDEYIDGMCSDRWMGIRYGFLRGVCGVSLRFKLKYVIRLIGCMILGNKDELYLLNALQCESHRWVAERKLKIENKI